MTNKPDMSAEVIAVPAELFRQLKHYTICHLMNFPSCGAPTEAEIDAALLANAAVPVVDMTTLQAVYAAGFRRAAVWAGRDDLPADVGSPAYLKDMAGDLAEFADFAITPAQPVAVQEAIPLEGTDAWLLWVHTWMGDHGVALKNDAYMELKNAFGRLPIASTAPASPTDLAMTPKQALDALTAPPKSESEAAALSAWAGCVDEGRKLFAPTEQAAPKAEPLPSSYQAGTVTSQPDGTGKVTFYFDDAADAAAWHASVIHNSTKAQANGTPGADAGKRLIGWRSADYTMETADPDKAKNWSGSIEVLPIFEGDVNTKLAARDAQGKDGGA